MMHYSYRYPGLELSPTSNTLVIYWATDYFDNTEFIDIIEANIEGSLAPAAVVVILRDPLVEVAAKTLKDNSTAQARVGLETPITLIGYNYLGKETKRQTAGETSSQSTFDVNTFHRHAVTDIFRKRQGFVDATPSYHFKNPSDRHSTKFIRLANILSVSPEIGFLSYCALQFIPPQAQFAYIDTPALHSLTYAIQEQLKFFDSSRNFQADNFESYFNFNSLDFKYIEDAVFIISASSSGGLAERLIKEKSVSPEKIFHVLFLGSKAPKFRIICNLEGGALNPNGYPIEEAVPADSCAACKTHSVAIPIQSDQFTFAGPQAEPLLIVEEHLHKEFKSFVECTIGAKALQIGLANTIQTVGDHKYFIDMAALLKSSRFKEKVNYLVKRSFPIGAEIIICANNDSKELAKHIAAQVTQYSPVSLIDISDIGSIKLSDSRPIVVVADAVESGRSLQDISRRLRYISNEVPIVYLVGLAKTSGERSRESLKSTLVFSGKSIKHVFESVQNVCLPSSSEQHAWIEERDLLRTPNFLDSQVSDAVSFFKTRLSILDLSSQPLVDNLFVANTPEAKLQLQPGFAFWKEIEERETTQADVYFTIAAVLQHLRAQGSNDKPLGIPLIRSNWLQQTLIDPESFNRFNDDVIQSSLLRAAHPRELNYSSSETLSKQVLEIIIQLIEGARTNASNAASEFLLALATDRLRLRFQELNRVSETESADLPPVIRSLLKYIQLREPAPSE